MIKLTRTIGLTFFVNPHWIISMERGGETTFVYFVTNAGGLEERTERVIETPEEIASAIAGLK